MDIKFVQNGLKQLADKLEGWGVGLMEMIPNLAIAIIVFIVFLALSRWIEKLVMKAFGQSSLNKSLEQLLANIAKVATICLGVVFALGILELQKTVFSLLAGVGVIGLALGFAFQDLAANFISGVMLSIRAPIKIGDVIKINDIQGSVIAIRLRDTLVRNFDGQDVFIPNKEFTTSSFINYSSYGQRKIKIEVGIGYEDDARKGVEVMQKALQSVDGILEDPVPDAYIGELAGSSVNLFGHVWYTYPGGSYFQIQSDAIAAVKEALEKEGFNIPFPIRTLETSPSLEKMFLQGRNANSGSNGSKSVEQNL